MKSKFSYLFGVLAVGLVVLIVWTASLAAQQAADRNTIRIKQPTPSDAARFEIQGVVVPQNQNPPPLNYGAPPVQGKVSRAPGQAFLGPGVFPTLAAPPDAKTAELIGAYLVKQREIDQLVKKYSAATGESDKNSLRDEIVQATATQFDLRQQIRAWEIERLKKRLSDVETTVEKRNELKDKIVEKRVADILREPDQLGWEPLGSSPGSMFAPGSGVQPTPYSSGQVVPIVPVPEVTYVPRTVVKYEEETIVDPEGNKKVIRRPVSETVYEAVEGEEGNKPSAGVQSPVNDHSPHSALQSTATLPTVGHYQPIQLTPSNMNITVAEAAARVSNAQQKRDLLLKQSRVVNPNEMQPLDAELALARVMLSRAQAEYEGRTKLLELDVRRAEVIHEQAVAALDETDRVNKAAPNTFPTTQVATQKAAVEQARIELERAKTVLDIHQKSNAPQAELPPR